MGFTIRPLHAFSRFAQVERSAAAAWVLVGVLGCAGVATAAPVTLNIPAQDLAEALRAFSDQSGIQVLYEPSLLEGKRASAISGQMDSSAAVGRLLQGSGIRYRMEGSALLLLPPSDGSAVELGATNINSSGLGAATEHTGSYTTGSVSIGKLPTSIKDTPQSVSVITRQRIEDQHLTTMNDVLTQTTGVSSYQGGTTDSRYLARGFEITNFRVDGGAPVTPVTFAWKDMDMALYDHVEVLRGADGLYSGNGEPGGSINFVRKRPTIENQLSITQSVGSWDDYRTELDVSGPLGFDGRVRGRSIIVYQDRNSYLDKFDADRKLFHGVVEADITERTLLTLGYTHDRFNSSDQTYGLPRYSNGRDLDLPRSTFLAGNHDSMIRHGDNVYARVEHRFNDDWLATIDAIYAQKKQYRDFYNFYGAIDPQTNAGSQANWSYQDEMYRDRSVDASLKGSFEFLGGHHDALLGYTWQSHRETINGYGWASGGLVSVSDIFAFDSDGYPSHRDNKYPNKIVPTYTKQQGIYGSLRLQLADPLHIIIGGRYNDYYYTTAFSGYNVAGASTFSNSTTYKDDNVFTPFVAATYRLSDEWTAYTSVADIYLSQASYLKGPSPGSSSLEPIRGRAYEIGVKGELLDGRVNTTSAIYYTKREGEALRDTRYPSTTSGQGASCCWLDEGEVVSKGVEFEIGGEIVDRLEGTFGYTYNHKESTGSNNSTSAAALSLTPKHLGKAFLSYRMPGALENLRVGGGVSVQSKSFVSESNIDITQSGYAIYNAFADYRINNNWVVALNGNNLADKKYYSTVGYSYWGNFYGDPRSFVLSLRGSY